MSIYSFKEGVNRDEAKGKVIDLIVEEIAGHGKVQYEIAKCGIQGINYMTEGQVAERCSHYGLDEYVNVNYMKKDEYDKQIINKGGVI